MILSQYTIYNIITYTNTYTSISLQYQSSYNTPRNNFNDANRLVELLENREKDREQLQRNVVQLLTNDFYHYEDEIGKKLIGARFHSNPLTLSTINRLKVFLACVCVCVYVCIKQRARASRWISSRCGESS